MTLFEFDPSQLCVPPHAHVLVTPDSSPYPWEVHTLMQS